MKNYLFLFVALLGAITSSATTKTVIGNAATSSKAGWANPDNWSPFGVPQSGDIILIPAGQTISVKNNIYTVPITLTIQIYGTLDFDPSGKLNLSATSTVQLYTILSKITSNNTSSEQIIIGGGVKYDGRNDNTVTGPAFTNFQAPNSSPQSGDAGFLVGVLPVKLTSFSASNSRDGVYVQWTSAQEFNLNTYELQRSGNGINEWKTVAIKTSKNNCDCPTSYSFLDSNPQGGKNYYRLKANEGDGSAEFSRVVLVNSTKPNYKVVSWSQSGSEPVVNLMINGSQMSFPVVINLFSLDGKLIKKASAITSALTVQIDHRYSGALLLQVIDAKGKGLTEKIFLK